MILVKKPTVNRKSSKGNDSNGLTINNLNKFVVRHLDRLSTCPVRANAQFRLRRGAQSNVRPSLTPALRLGLVCTRRTMALARMAQ